MAKYQTRNTKSNIVEVNDHTFFYGGIDPRIVYKWTGGVNGSKNAQLPRKVIKNQIAAREIYMLYYDAAVGELYSKSHIHVIPENKYNMNPHQMYLLDTNTKDICDVTDLLGIEARKVLKKWISEH